MQEAFAAFPGLIRFLTDVLQEKLNHFERVRTGQTGYTDGLTATH